MPYTNYPKGASAEAKKAIDFKKKNGSKCGTSVGWSRARQLVAREALSEKDVKDIHSFLSRAKVYNQGKFTDEDGKEICGSIMYAAWGGDVMSRWAARIAEQLRSKINMERRYITGAEVRVKKDEGSQKKGVQGYGIVFNEMTQLGEDLYEIIERDGFEGSGDMIVTFNHNFDQVLGRESSGTATFKVDEKGVFYEVAEMPNTSYAKDLAALLERGDVNGSSFMFESLEEDYEEIKGGYLRRVKKYKVHEMGAVTLPAYTQTSSLLLSGRSLEKLNELKRSKEIEEEEEEKKTDFNARFRKFNLDLMTEETG